MDTFYTHAAIIPPPAVDDIEDSRTYTRLVVCSSNRDAQLWPSPAQYTYELDDDVHDVLSAELLVADIPSRSTWCGKAGRGSLRMVSLLLCQQATMTVLHWPLPCKQLVQQLSHHCLLLMTQHETALPLQLVLATSLSTSQLLAACTGHWALLQVCMGRQEA